MPKVKIGNLNFMSSGSQPLTFHDLKSHPHRGASLWYTYSTEDGLANLPRCFMDFRLHPNLRGLNFQQKVGKSGGAGGVQKGHSP